MTFEESMYEAGREILDLIGEASADSFLQGDGDPVKGRVTSRTGGLMNSILGGTDSIRKIEVGESNAVFTIGSTKPYAALMEKGGVRVVTEKMRKFFWHKYFTETGASKGMWARLRFKNVIRYEPRPYLMPAAEEVVKTELPKILSKYVYRFLKYSIEEVITGTPRAVPLNAIK